MEIHKCALAVITEKGRKVRRPVLSRLDSDENDFLGRHVDELRATTGAGAARGRPRPESDVLAQLEELLTSSNDRFLEIAADLVGALADAMTRTSNAPDCVVAVLTTGDSQPSSTNVLKLDAEIEAAHLEEADDHGIRIRVFQDLLPRPGELQKGLSWPDPRSPSSELIVLDVVKRGSAAEYFQAAMGVEASPQAQETEAELVKAIASLPNERLPEVLEAAAEGGPAEDVVMRIKERVPYFEPQAPALGGAGQLAGTIRPGFAQTAVRTLTGDGIEIRVRLDKMGDITTEPYGERYRTIIITDTPIIAKRGK